MKMRLILTAFIAIFLGLTHGKLINQASHSEVQENLRDVFDLIKKNDAKNIENVWNILRQEAALEQQAFDMAKDKLRLARQKSVHKQKNVEYQAAFKREVNNEKKSGDATSTMSSNLLKRTINNVEDLHAELKNKENSKSRAFNSGLYKAGTLLLPMISSLRKDLVDITARVKRLASARNMQYSIEIFLKLYLLAPEEGWLRQGQLHNTCFGVIENRRKKFSNIMMMFGSVILQPEEDEKSWKNTFEKALEFLHKVLPCGSKVRDTTLEISTSLNVSTALTQLSKATTTDEAIKLFWTSQKQFWEKLEMTDKALTKGLNELAGRLSISDQNFILEKAVNPNELAYLSGVLQIKRIFHEKSTDIYAKCTWIMYNSAQSEIEKMESDLKIYYPNATRSSRIDEYCFRISKWYQLLSDAAFYVPESISLPQSCRPDTKDYKDYLNSVAAKEGDNDMYTVGLILKNLYHRSDA